MRCLAICFVVESIFNVSLPNREVGIQQEKMESLLIMFLLFLVKFVNQLRSVFHRLKPCAAT